MVARMRYDGLGRRITKAVDNSADWHATVHYYSYRQRMIETRDGSFWNCGLGLTGDQAYLP